MQLPVQDFGSIDFGAPRLQRHWKNSLSMRRFGLRLLALCAWPEEEDSRKKFEASYLATMIGSLKELPPDFDTSGIPPHVVRAAANAAATRLDPLFQSVGGLLSVVNAPALGVQAKTIASKIAPAWQSVSAQLRLTRSIAFHHPEIAGGASLTKARFVLNGCSNWGTTTLEANWTRFYPVAHFCAAIGELSDFHAKWQGTDEPIHWDLFLDALPVLLATAYEFERWGTSYVSHSQGEPILTPERIWSAATPANPWTVVIPPPSPLTDTQLATLREYRAPKRVK